MAYPSHGNLIDEASILAVGGQPRDVEAGQILLESLDKDHEVVHSKDVILHEAPQVGWGLQRTVEGVTNYTARMGASRSKVSSTRPAYFTICGATGAFDSCITLEEVSAQAWRKCWMCL